MWRDQKTVLVKIIFIIGAIVSSVSSISSFQTSQNNRSDVCYTTGCTRAASEALTMMDFTVNPCDDFYRFACGNFVKKTIIPNEKLWIDTSTISRDEVYNQLYSVIVEGSNQNDPASFDMAKRLYRICMDDSLIEKRGLEPFFRIMDGLGGWPVVKGDQWNENSWTWTSALKEFRKMGFGTSYIFDLSITPDKKNSIKQKIYIASASLALDREYLSEGLQNKNVKSYYEYMVDVAVILGANRRRAETEMRESLEFEIKLANIPLLSGTESSYSSHYNPQTLREVQLKYPYIQWVEHINAMLTPPSRVNEKEMIVVWVPAYFEKLGGVLNSTPKRVIANYLMWRIARFSSFFLTNELSQRKSLYTRAISGQRAPEPRWKQCILITGHRFPIALGAMYVRKFFRQGAPLLSTAMEIVSRIRNEFERTLKGANWMDGETRRLALNKLNAMSSFVGFADELMNNFKINEFYRNLNADENNFLSFILSVDKFDNDRDFGKLRETVNKKDWRTRQPPFLLNAFYSTSENSIQVPAAILQGHWFSTDRPHYLNFATIGSIIGHEITHGFDNIGSQFSSEGNLIDWWQPVTKSNYLKRVNCVIDQYGNYVEPMTGLRLNGVNTQGENVADIGGIKGAYLAYRTWQSGNVSEPKLPDLNFTPRQIFWIAAAQNWCSVPRLESLRDQILTNQHSPNRFRVIGMLRNQREFANDFQCREGTSMNPAKKCDVW